MKTNNIDKVLVALRDEMTKRDKHPHLHFAMEDWVHVPDQVVDDDLGPYSFKLPKRTGPPTLCKTAACIAGTAAVLLAPEKIFKWVEREHHYGHIVPGHWRVTGPDDGWDELGAELLGLPDHDMAMALFRRSEWPHYLLDEHGLNSTTDELACAIWLLQEIREERLGWDESEGAWTYGDFCYPKGWGASYDADEDEWNEWEESDEDDEHALSE